MGQSTGITWAEMSLSWMLFNKCFLPIRRKDQWNVERLIHPGTYADAKDGGRIFQSLVLIASICLSMFNHLWSNRFFRSWLRVSVVPATLWASKHSTRVSNCDRLSHFRLKSSNCCSSILRRGRCGSWMFYLRFALHRSIIFTLSLGRSFTERVIWR